MAWSPSAAPPGRSDSRAFLTKAARSVAELQPKVNNVADVLVFLEILGYTNQDALHNGFDDLLDMSRRIYEFVDIFEPRVEDGPGSLDAYVKVPTIARRLGEGFALSFGWLGSLLILFVAGVSLWLSLLLPLKVTTVFLGGLFAGLFITEGPLQSFNRLFSFYHDQGNVAEAKRVLKRTYLIVAGVVALTASALYAVASLTGFPIGLFEIGIASLVLVSLQRVVYAIIYPLRKIAHLVVSYSLAFAVLLLIYFGAGTIVPDAISRYLYALIGAVVVLCSFALYDQFQVLRGKSFQMKGPIPNFFKRTMINKTTIRSKVSVQFWETVPSYLFGTFFFVLIFGDRVLSWFFNPIKVANGITLPFVFNSAYHSGADPALLIIFPALILQYALMRAVYGQVTNATLASSVLEASKVRQLLVKRYETVMAASLLASGAAAIALIYLAPMFLPAVSLTPTTLQILHIASVANIFLVVFLANTLFLQLLNKMLGLALITIVGGLVVLIGGLIAAQTGFQNLELAYFAAAITVAAISTFYVLSNLGRATSIFFGRYV